MNISKTSSRPFPSCLKPLFKSEAECKAIDVIIVFSTHANKTHFHKKSLALSLVLKVEVFGTRKWPIERRKFGRLKKHVPKSKIRVPTFF